MTPRGSAKTIPARARATIGASRALKPKAQATAEPMNHPTRNQSGAAAMRFMRAMFDRTMGRHNSPLVPVRDRLRAMKVFLTAQTQHGKFVCKVRPAGCEWY